MPTHPPPHTPPSTSQTWSQHLHCCVWRGCCLVWQPAGNSQAWGLQHTKPPGWGSCVLKSAPACITICYLETVGSCVTQSAPAPPLCGGCSPIWQPAGKGPGLGCRVLNIAPACVKICYSDCKVIYDRVTTCAAVWRLQPCMAASRYCPGVGSCLLTKCRARVVPTSPKSRLCPSLQSIPQTKHLTSKYTHIPQPHWSCHAGCHCKHLSYAGMCTTSYCC